MGLSVRPCRETGMKGFGPYLCGGLFVTPPYGMHKKYMNLTNIDSGGSPAFLDQELIRSRIKNFWGYGNLSGNIWLVGMEEGHNESNEILLERFKATAHGSIFDIFDDLKVDPGHARWFEDDAPTQATYRRLIYLLLYLRTGKEPTLEEIRDFQIKQFGRKTSDHAVLELMPLPAKSTKESDWTYGSSEVEGLESRKAYLEQYSPERIVKLRHMIREFNPKLVLFYSRTYLPYWEKVALDTFQEVLPGKLSVVPDEKTTYAVIPHSTSIGLSNADMKTIAEALLSTHPPVS